MAIYRLVSITVGEPGKEKRISIECRKRDTRQDVTWIEQLATKMRALRLDGTIAVSSKGFSKAAHLKAKHHGITLNTYCELQLPLGPRPLEIRHLQRSWSLISLEYEVAEHCPEVSQSLQSELTSMLSSAVPDTPLLRVIGSNETFTIRQFVENALGSSAKHQVEPSKRRTFKANLLKPTTLICFPDSIALVSVRFEVDVRIQEVSTTEPMFGDYAGVNGSLMKVAAVKFERSGRSFDLNVYFTTSESE